MDELSPDEGEDPYANDPFFKMVHDVEWNACIGMQGEGVGTRAVRNRTLRANEAGTLGSPPQPAAAHLEGEATGNLPTDDARYPKCKCLSD